jgi:hypothetical protein
LYAVLGVAIGALVHGQVGAVLTAVIGLTGIEALLETVVPAGFLPSGAADTLARLTAQPVWQGAGVLAAYVGGVTALALLLTIPRDRI